MKLGYDLNNIYEKSHHGNQNIELLDDQQEKYVFFDPITDYMKDFNSKDFHLLISCTSANENDGQLVSKILPRMILLQLFYADFQSFHYRSKLALCERKYAVDRLLQYDCLLFSFEDPFTSLLESSVKVDLVLFTSAKIGFNLRFELLLPFNIPVFILLKHNQAIRLCKQLLDWLYWKFEIT